MIAIGKLPDPTATAAAAIGTAGTATVELSESKEDSTSSEEKEKEENEKDSNAVSNMEGITDVTDGRELVVVSTEAAIKVEAEVGKAADVADIKEENSTDLKA